jgi:uncharacterized membrane protein YjjP (DUF1212 family)
MTAAIIDILVGLWIFMSTFAWQHTTPEFINTIVCGALAVWFGIAALADRRARYLELALASWLLLSGHVLTGASRETLWNNTVCAFALFVGGLLGGWRRRAHDLRAGTRA